MTKNPKTGLLRVLHVVLDLEAGGLERMVADLIRQLDPEKFEVHLLAIHFLGRYADGLESYCSLHVAPKLSRWSMIWPRALADEFIRIKPDILHSHSGVWYKTALAARLACLSHHVHTDHGRQFPDPLADRVLDNLASRWTSAVVAVSEPLADHLAHKVVACPNRIHTIANGIDTDFFTPGPKDVQLLKELGLDEGSPIIGSLGRFDPIKGYDIVLLAFTEVLKNWPSGKKPLLVLAGEGPETNHLYEIAKTHGISNHVLFPGWCTNPTAFYRSFDVFVLGSRSEGTSISLLEAMSCGTCPVVTDVGGTAQVLGDKLCHRLSPPENPAALADLLRSALFDPVQRQRDGVVARTRVIDCFSLRQMVERYESLYESVLSSNSPSQ